MQANVGLLDRIIRFIVGVTLIAAPNLTTMEMWANPMIEYGANALGAILILTGLVSFCPLSKLLGVNTVRS